MWQIWLFFMAKFANFCGKIWQNLRFQMAIFCDARPLPKHQIGLESRFKLGSRNLDQNLNQESRCGQWREKERCPRAGCYV